MTLIPLKKKKYIDTLSNGIKSAYLQQTHLHEEISDAELELMRELLYKSLALASKFIRATSSSSLSLLHYVTRTAHRYCDI